MLVVGIRFEDRGLRVWQGILLADLVKFFLISQLGDGLVVGVRDRHVLRQHVPVLADQLRVVIPTADQNDLLALVDILLSSRNQGLGKDIRLLQAGVDVQVDNLGKPGRGQLRPRVQVGLHPILFIH